MKQLLRHLLLLACWLGANGAFAGLYVGRDDKPKTTPKAFNNHAYNVDVPPLGGANHATGVAKPASHPIAQTVVGVSGVNPAVGVVNVAASSVKKLQNAQLSNALDKAVAQMGDVMALMDYSDMPAERAEVFVDASTNADRAEAQALFDEIAKGNRYIKAINKGAVLALPQGIRWGDVDEAGNSKGGNSITVGIASAIFKPEYTVLKMYVKIEIETPNSIERAKKVIFFGSDNIKLSQDGGFIGDTRLVLLGDYKIPFGKYDFIMRGGLNKSTGAFADFTYVSIDCNGFRELKVSGSLQFPTNVLVKIDPVTGVVETGKNVIGEIAATVYDINDLRFDVSLNVDKSDSNYFFSKTILKISI
ncbi:hypothetical protein LV89_03313 [Arcicella aurantiaca]|uniref:LPP20 lipoprotein n=1 Tax=Arcicella aurantiaca TaxID=591202 RepID=A0A316DY76_9BACT|nr:hypothetical protein [Arcicella aurantiaca]PWK23044.1 hypothetical protein LV89_03313 [Arcicella aurantiaca]